MIPPPFSLLAYLQGPRHKLGPVFACSPRGPASDVGLTSWRSTWRKGRGLLFDSLSKSLITPYAHPTHHPMLLPRAGKGPSPDFPLLFLALQGQIQAGLMGEITERRVRCERLRQRNKQSNGKKVHSKSYHSIHKLNAALQLGPGVTVLTE